MGQTFYHIEMLLKMSSTQSEVVLSAQLPWRQLHNSVNTIQLCQWLPVCD